MTELRRALGLASLTFYGVGLILGAGIYSIIGEAAGVAGSGLWLAFALASLVALLTGLSYAELATMYPAAGAEYVYLGKAWPTAGWVRTAVGWAVVAAGVATTATVALAFGGYGASLTGAPPAALAVALLAGATGLNVLGVREASWANIVFTIVEAAGLVALVVVGANAPDFGEALLARPHSGMIAAAGLVFFAFLGFENIANLAEEARHPSRDLPRAILIAVGASSVLYVLVALASVALLAPEELGRSGAPLADAMRQGAPRLAGALGGIALFATANTALVAITTASRLLLGMARERDAPPAFARVLSSRQTPAAAILLVALAAAAFLPLGRVAVVGSVASLLSLTAFVGVNAALIRLRRTRAAQPRPFRVPGTMAGWPLLPAFAIGLCVALALRFEPMAYALAAGALVAGVLLAATSRRASRT